jgi:hypothetical protein
VIHVMSTPVRATGTATLNTRIQVAAMARPGGTTFGNQIESHFWRILAFHLGVSKWKRIS